MAKRIFIAATRQNDGKTTASLGLIYNLKERFKNIGFMKPIGQRYLEEQGLKVDEDSVLIEEVFGIKCGLKDMSPVAVERGFTEKYITNPEKVSISKRIKDSFRHVEKGQDLVIIEGTGHAGVGSVFDHSNAAVAKLLGSKVILISSGGVGRPIDEIMLNKALFDKQGVKLLGVIINKVLPQKFDKIKQYVIAGLKRQGVEVLGVIPYNPMLSAPTVGQVMAETGFKVLSGEEGLKNQIKKILVGAMEPHNAVNYIQEGSLLITAGDREDIMLTALSMHLSNTKPVNISGIVVTGDIAPHKSIMDLVKNTSIPVLISNEDTYTVASMIHDLTVKVRAQDKEKISTIVQLVKDNVNMKKIAKGI